uniref:TBCC domain-containing protein 1 n=1 Tax=Crepidula fornicata TaxID=176853 RepID=D6QXB9_CREFO|nr:crystallin gamma S-like protein [Crepidula fornicata]
MSSRVGVELWVKAEPFSYGALPVAPHPRLNFTNIKKIVIYAKNKGNAGFPKLSYSVWKHIACNKLHLTEDLAWVYFETCYFLTTDLSPVERAERDERFASAETPERKSQLRTQYSIDTLKFVLFLYIQQVYRVSLRASLVAGDEWPTQTTSSLELDGRSTPRGSKSLDDHSHLVFVQSNLSEIAELLSESDGTGGGGGGASGSANSGSLPLAGVEALGFLITGTAEKSVEKKTIMSLQDIAVLQTVIYRSGYSKATKMFSSKHFQLWIKDCLTQNPYSVSACIALGTRLSWPFAREESEQGEQAGMSATGKSKRGKIATNAHIVPKEHITGNKLIIMSQVSKQTIARSSGTLEMSTVKIHRSHFSYIYLMSPLRSVTVEKCRNTTVIVGPVEAFVHVSNCENVTIIAPCRTIMVSGSTLCTLYLLTPNRPLLLSGNDTIVLAPYHTHYPALGPHMSRAGLTTSLNLWDHPLCIGPDHRDDVRIWELMTPSDFYTFAIPFQMEGPTKSIPGGLPSRYQRAVSQQQRQIDSWQRTVKEAGLTRDQRKEFQALVESRFHIWLSETDHKRELDSLAVPLQQDC